MARGKIADFVTDKAVGHDARRKFHIDLGQSLHFRAPAPYMFMFISSGDYGGCFPILKRDYEFLSYDSYISCNGLVFYTYEELKAVPRIVHVGDLVAAHKADLRNHLIDHEIMENWQISEACNALAS